VSTRAYDLDKAIKDLYRAICAIDCQASQRQALESMLDGSVKDLVDEFVKIEELHRVKEILGHNNE